MDVSNISNCGNLTARQILEYEEEGADIPDEYLEWAESVGSNCESTYDETKSAASTLSSTLTSTASQINEANQAREELVAAGVSLKDLAEIFTDESTYQQEKLVAAEATLENLSAQSKAVGAEITATTATTQSKVSTLESQLAEANAAAANATTDEEAAAAQNTAAGLSDEISTTTSTATTSTTAKTNTLSTVGAKILAVFDMSIDSKEIGDETIDIAKNLNGKVAENAAKQKSVIAGAGIGGAIGTAVAFGAAALGVISGGLAIAGVAILGAGIGAVISLFGGKKDSGKGANYEEAKAAFDAGSELNAVAAKAKSEAQLAASANNMTIQEAQSAQKTDTASTPSVDSTVDASTKGDETSTKKKG